MLKTCIESDAYMGGYDYEEGFKRLKEHGFDAIDYEGFFTDSEPFNKYSDQDYLEYIRKYKKAADDNGIEIFQVHGINPLKGYMTVSGSHSFSDPVAFVECLLSICSRSS